MRFRDFMDTGKEEETMEKMPTLELGRKKNSTGVDYWEKMTVSIRFDVQPLEKLLNKDLEWLFGDSDDSLEKESVRMQS